MLGLRLRTNGRQKLPKGMAFNEIAARKKDADEIKSHWTGHMEEGYRFAVPSRNTFYNQTPGEKKNLDIFDATAVLGVPQFATKMQASLLPPWREFTQLVFGPDVPKTTRENSRSKLLLAEQTDTLFSHVNHSNMPTQVHESFQDLAIGTGCYDLLAGKLGQKALRFNAIPIPELSLEEGPDSTIETSYRSMMPRGRNIGRLWPGAVLTGDLERQVRENPNGKYEFCEAVIFDPDMERWEGAVTHAKTKSVIWRATWNTNPRIVFRWSVTPGEIWGRGPILQVLPDIKTANKVVEFILRNAALQVAGMWTATADSGLNAFNFRIVPGGVTSVMSNSRDNPTIRALERSGDLALGFEVLEQLQKTIKRALFQHLREPDDSVISATQFAIEDRELVNQAGSSFGRLQTEVVEATTVRAVDILGQRGAMAQMRIDGRLLTLKHLSPLARAQDMDDLLTLQRTLEITPEASVAIGIKIEDLGSWVAEKTGLDPRLIRDPQEKAALQQKAAELIAQSQAQRAA